MSAPSSAPVPVIASPGHADGAPAHRSSPRRHDLDVLRVGVFALLILYHVGMGYVADWGWHVKSAHTVEWLQGPMMVVNRWRMPLLFLISGAAIGMVGARAAGWGFARERIVRLLVPLLFAMVAIVPVQAWCQAAAQGAWSGSFPGFLVAYFTFAPWPPGAFDGAEVGVTWNHLWYLVYLLAYTLILAGLMPLLRPPAVDAALSRLSARAVWVWIPIVAAAPALSAILLADAWPPTNNFFADWYQHGVYLPVFVLGFLVARAPGFWASIVAGRWRLLIAAVVSGAVYFAALRAAGDDAAAVPTALVRVLRMLYMAAAMLAILAWSKHRLDRPFRWLPRATEALFPWYILHQSLIVPTLFLLADSGLPPAAEAAIVLAVTLVGCALGAEAIRRVAWLRPLFGLKPARPAQRTPARAAVAG